MQIVRNIVIIAVIVFIIFLGQQPYFQEQGKFWLQKVNAYIGPYWQKWVSGEVDKRKEIITQEIEKEKEKISQSIWQQIKKFLAEKFSNISGTKVEP